MSRSLGMDPRQPIGAGADSAIQSLFRRQHAMLSAPDLFHYAAGDTRAATTQLFRLVRIVVPTTVNHE